MKNSKKQGDLGTSFAIAYFSGLGYNVSVPISDSQPYDLIVEDAGICKRVQVKTCFKKKYASYAVELRTVSNTRGKQFDIRFLSKSETDLVFIMSGDGSFYLYPVEALENKHSLRLNKSADAFKVPLKTVFHQERILAS